MKAVFLLVAFVAGLVVFQGEKKQEPPKLPPLEKGKEASPPPGQRSADSPYENVPSDTDLIQRFANDNPFLGVWSVLSFARPGLATSRGSGYLIFTRGFLSMHLYMAGTAPGARPRFQSAVRGYRVEGPHLVVNSIMGVRNGVRQGEILIEGAGPVQRRRFQFFGHNVLRIYQGPNAYLELKKVEDL